VREQTGLAVQHEITFTNDVFDVVVVTSGVASLAGFRAFVEELVASPEYRPGMNILVDHTGLDANRLAASDMQAIADLVVEFYERIGPGLCATVVPSPHKFRLAQIWQQLVERKVLMRTGVFYSREFARSWLRREHPPSGTEPQS
jgi:hypothetical protein